MHAVSTNKVSGMLIADASAFAASCAGKRAHTNRAATRASVTPTVTRRATRDVRLDAVPMAHDATTVWDELAALVRCVPRRAPCDV
jgi:hypothetical protein